MITPVFAQTTSTVPMVPTYKKPLLPPEEPTPEEVAEEQPMKQALQGAAIQTGFLVVPQLLLKGFSNKYDKENCLAQNMYFKEEDATKNGFSYWSGVSLDPKEPATCITCCREKEGKTADTIKEDEDKREERRRICNEKTDEVAKTECLDGIEKEAFQNAAGCLSQKDPQCENKITKYIEQINDFCGKSKNESAGICLDMKK